MLARLSRLVVQASCPHPPQSRQDACATEQPSERKRRRRAVYPCADGLARKALSAHSSVRSRTRWNSGAGQPGRPLLQARHGRWYQPCEGTCRLLKPQRTDQILLRADDDVVPVGPGLLADAERLPHDPPETVPPDGRAELSSHHHGDAHGSAAVGAYVHHKAIVRGNATRGEHPPDVAPATHTPVTAKTQCTCWRTHNNIVPRGRKTRITLILTDSTDFPFPCSAHESPSSKRGQGYGRSTRGDLHTKQPHGARRQRDRRFGQVEMSV